MHDSGDKEKEKGGKKLVGTREGGGGGQRERMQFMCSHQRLSRCRKLQKM